jgi:hypothetical protein
VQEGSNFIQDELMTLKEVSFLFFEKSKCHLKNPFGEEASLPINRPIDVDSWPKTQNKKSIHCPLKFKISIQD